jgi:alkylhydroperoxidase family enzyme
MGHGQLDSGPSSGRAALERFAPRASAALDSIEAAMWQTVANADRIDLVDLAARVEAGQHRLPPLERPASQGASPWTRSQAASWREIDGLDQADRTALRFAQQLSFDVASLQKAERKVLFEQLGPSALPFVQAAWVADFLPRARFALDALFGPSPAFECATGAEDEDLMAAIEELIRVVPQLQALDPVTTELVRLLGARRHRCRLCQSLRSRSALAAGADDALFEAVDRHETSDLSEARKAALAFVEVMLTTPGQITDERVAALRAHYEPAACVEIVLDVTRNATNKVAVALGADAPHVESGYEIYDVGPDGELLFGLQVP